MGSKRGSKRRKARRAAELQRKGKAKSLTPLVSSEHLNKTEDPPKKDAPRPTDTRTKLLKVLTAMGGGAAFVLWGLGVTFNGFFNFFSERPAVQLIPFALALCATTFTALRVYGGAYSNRKRYYWAGGFASLCVLIITYHFVSARTHEILVAAAERKQEHNIITNVLDSFSRVDKRVTSLRSVVSNLGPQSQTLSSIEQEISMNARRAMARHREPPEFPSGAPGVHLVVGDTAHFFYGTPQLENAGPPLLLLPAGDLVLPYLTNNRVYIKAQLPVGGPETTVKMNAEWLG